MGWDHYDTQSSHIQYNRKRLSSSTISSFFFCSTIGSAKVLQNHHIDYHTCVYCRMLKNKTQNTKYVNKIPCTTNQILIWSVTELRSHCGETIQHNGRRCPSMSHALPSSVHLYWCLLFFLFQFKSI